MQSQQTNINLGSTQAQMKSLPVEGDYVQLLGETYYRIRNYDQMPSFFMSLVSSADHWLFISSTGGLTAGRTNAESALFPYETDDKIAANSEYSGTKTIFLVTRGNGAHLWEPFSQRYAGLYRCERSLYKNIYGNKIVFEEVNHDLQLTYRYAGAPATVSVLSRAVGCTTPAAMPAGLRSLTACKICCLTGPLQPCKPLTATCSMPTNATNLNPRPAWAYLP